ncbi:helix-turn-helix domain-containing protein [Wolbachia endosymbiont of Cantharis cryptica]|uniref:helix-turn-helix domain-containing protein n=1 Tax=Wolbachia endosymbiont of Cantharis cryptica TaxID=3066132 RepID=UPI00376ED70F
MEIAKYLEKQGYRSPKKNVVLRSTVESIRLKNNIFRKRHQPYLLAPGYLTVTQVAKILKVSRNWLYHRINSGKIKMRKDDSKAKGKYLFEDKPETIKILMDFKNGKFNNINFL